MVAIQHIEWLRETSYNADWNSGDWGGHLLHQDRERQARLRPVAERRPDPQGAALEADGLLLWAQKIPEDTKGRVLECTDVFRKILLNEAHLPLFKEKPGLERSTIGHEPGHWDLDQAPAGTQSSQTGQSKPKTTK